MKPEKKYIIELKEISKFFKKNDKNLKVLDKISYNFKKGKFYCITGKSGSGKTTFINIIGMINNADNGDYLLNGQQVKKMNDETKSKIRNQKIGFVFQDFYLISTMTALENVMLPIYFNKDSTIKTKIEKAKHLLEKLGLGDRINHFPKEMSGGEQQRVAIARALINNPDVILADEPTGSLDKETTEEVLNILSFLSSQGKCVIVVSHDTIVEKYADIVLLLKKSKLLEREKINE